MQKKAIFPLIVFSVLLLWFLQSLYGTIVDSERTLMESMFSGISTGELVFRIFLIIFLISIGILLYKKLSAPEESIEKIEIEIPEGIRKLAERDPEFLLSFLHRIRMELNNVLGFADLLRDEENSDDQSDRYFGYIETSKQSTLSAIDELVGSLKLGNVKSFETKDDYLEIINWRGKKILIAEDVEMNYILLKAVLEKTGAEVLWAKDGNEALKLLRKNPDINLILMDILMPGMDGFEATKAIRKYNTKIPIIAQTAYNFDWTAINKEGLGFTDFISKPIGHYDLILKTYRYLDR